jgi:hypothetical protein
MAGRKIKLGIEYFPLEVSVFSDMKIRRLIRDNGGQALCVYLNLLCSIYKDGYYLKWINDIPFLISEDTKLDEDYVLKVVKSCLDHGLFSKVLFEKNGILTSKGIQERYKLICELSRRKVSINCFSLISSEEIGNNSEEISISSEEIGNNSDLMQQRKGKEIKEKEIKENTETENFNKFKTYNFSDIKKILTEKSQMWHEQIMMSDSRIKSDSQLNDIITKFLLKQNSTGSHFPVSIDDVRRHFAYTLPKMEIENASGLNASNIYPGVY